MPDYLFIMADIKFLEIHAHYQNKKQIYSSFGLIVECEKWSLDFGPKNSVGKKRQKKEA